MSENNGAGGKGKGIVIAGGGGGGDIVQDAFCPFASTTIMVQFQAPKLAGLGGGALGGAQPATIWAPCRRSCQLFDHQREACVFSPARLAPASEGDK